jgi:hypothetical protein
VGKRATSVLVAGVFVLGACAGGSKNAGPPSVASTSSTGAPRTTTVPRSTATTSTREYSFDASVPPPKLINTGTNYVAILESLNDYAYWLTGHHPDPALVSTIVVKGTKQHELFAQDLVRLRDNHLRMIEKVGDRPTTFAILSKTAHAFSARVVQDLRVRQLVESHGRVTSRLRFTKPTAYLMLVVLEQGRWYFAALDEEHPANVRL